MNQLELELSTYLNSLHAELRVLIESSRQRLSTTVNAELSHLYWMLGRRLSTEVLKGERAQYGGQIMIRMGKKLAEEFGRGFEVKNLRRMVQFAQIFPDLEKGVTLWCKLIGATSYF